MSCRIVHPLLLFLSPPLRSTASDSEASKFRGGLRVPSEYQIASQNPRALVIARAHAARNVRKRDVSDARVEHFHKRRERDHDSDEPWVDLWCSACRFNGDQCCSTHWHFLSGVPGRVAAHMWKNR